jgi:Domain of unknown function (DUF4124)
MPARADASRSAATSTLRCTRNIAAAAVFCAIMPMTQAAVYKCTDSGGKTTYSDVPCDSGSKPLALSDPSKAKGTDPHVCAQLQDELDRLAADADRNARRGKPESTSSANRRKSLSRQYADRCVSISRSR